GGDRCDRDQGRRGDVVVELDRDQDRCRGRPEGREKVQGEDDPRDQQVVGRHRARLGALRSVEQLYRAERSFTLERGLALWGESSQVEEKTVEEKERVVIRFAGDSGDGIQLSGNLFAAETALIGNDLVTLPDFPAEIRAPAGT